MKKQNDARPRTPERISGKKYSGAFEGYDPPRFQFFASPTKKMRTLENTLPGELRSPMPIERFRTEESLRDENRRRYKLLLSSLGFSVEGGEWPKKIDWHDAFNQLASITVRGLSRSRRGRPATSDQASYDRVYARPGSLQVIASPH